jgi:hypothetical protein
VRAAEAIKHRVLLVLDDKHAKLLLYPPRAFFFSDGCKKTTSDTVAAAAARGPRASSWPKFPKFRGSSGLKSVELLSCREAQFIIDRLSRAPLLLLLAASTRLPAASFTPWIIRGMFSTRRTY